MPDASPIVVRPCPPDDLARYWETFAAAFAHELDEETQARIVQEMGLDRLLAAYAGDEMVGVTGAHRFAVTVPGGNAVPAMGVAGVAVRPTHRRRGALTAMMRRQLDDARAGGEPLAILWVTETTIYGRFGFGSPPAAH